MQIKDTPKVLRDWQQGMNLNDITRKYGFISNVETAIAIQSAYRYLEMKGVNPNDPEGTGRIQKEPG